MTQKIAIIGAGTMGSGIAQVALTHSIEVLLVDIDEQVLQKGMEIIERRLARAVGPNEVEGRLALLQSSTVLDERLRSVDAVIEAVPERIDLKQRIFAKLDKFCNESANLYSNTSSLSITEIAAASSRPERVAGMHFFNPPHRMSLVEVIKGLQTSDETAESATELAKAMGREPIAVNEAPGFVAARVNAVIGNEAFRLLGEGVASAEDIDKALKLGLNHPMGPFELVDLVGLDVRLEILRYLQRTLGDFYRPHPLLIQYVNAGRLGRKSGHGIYKYDSEGRRI